MTLLELLVVLLLMGLAAALVAPALRRPADRAAATADPLGALADAARDAALRRGEAVVLGVTADGAWRLDPAVAAGADTAALLAGRLDVPPARALRLVVSPLGTCVPDATPGAAGAAAPPADGWVWDAARCRPERDVPRAPR